MQSAKMKLEAVRNALKMLDHDFLSEFFATAIMESDEDATYEINIRQIGINDHIDIVKLFQVRVLIPPSLIPIELRLSE